MFYLKRHGKFKTGFAHRWFTTDRFGTINTVAGVDIGLKKDIARASVVVLSFPELQVVDSVVTESPVRFPYIPGLLSFREIPPLLIDVFAVANGTRSGDSRRTGHRAPQDDSDLHSHLGLVLDKPTIGCAKIPTLGDDTRNLT